MKEGYEIRTFTDNNDELENCTAYIDGTEFKANSKNKLIIPYSVNGNNSKRVIVSAKVEDLMVSNYIDLDFLTEEYYLSYLFTLKFCTFNSVQI